MKEETLNDVKITDVFSNDFCIRISGSIGKRCSHLSHGIAMEMRRYLMRFVHHIGGLADFSALKFTKYNQYESLVLPMIAYLESHGVQFQYDVQVLNIKVDITTKRRLRVKYNLSVQVKMISFH